MVRLKVNPDKDGYLMVYYFNSTMVRLKAIVRLFRLILWIFQFHYGTIKRFPHLLTVRQVPISIPLWYD